ncbi:transmembrane protein 26, partial [Notothenia coriiceps]|uniref:Transmembrane protein 26 n=1 Tax=Notothenia coriiceps TaxID=8208 RepID=A0A6I9PNB1_9TELE
MFRLLNVLLALLSRFLFVVHGVVTVWRVVAVKGEPLYWLLLTGVALLGVEMAVTLKCTQNAEWKCSGKSRQADGMMLPEEQLRRIRIPLHVPVDARALPVGILRRLTALFGNHPPQPVIAESCDCKSQVGAMSFSRSPSRAPPWRAVARLFRSRSTSDGIVELDPENWVAGLEQTMLIVLVLGRWLMPKGDMSRDQLSQLLMVYVGLGADILDIFDTFKEPEVKTNRAVVMMGLGLFSWALMQFPLVLTQTQLPKGESPKTCVFCPGAPSWFTSCCSSEVWSLLLTVGLQDGPFLIYRLYLMVQEQVLNQLMIFFTCKNILIVLLELYRIFVVQCEQLVGESELERCTAL